MLLSEQICSLSLSAGFWIDWLFIKYLQLYFLRCFSSKKYWEKLRTVKTYCTLHVSSESGVIATEDFFHLDFLCTPPHFLFLFSVANVEIQIIPFYSSPSVTWFQDKCVHHICECPTLQGHIYKF